MRPFTLITFTLLFVMLSPAAAQEHDPTPWPPENPQALFGPDVEIISTEMDSSLFNQDGFYSDDANRILHIDRWGAYPFPYGFITAVRLYELPDNRAYISEQYTNDGAVRWWLLDLESASWLELREQPKQVQTLCGSIAFDEDRRSYVADRVSIIGSNQEQYFCDLASGNRNPAFRPSDDTSVEYDPIYVIELQESNSDTPQVSCEVRWQDKRSQEWTTYTLPTSCQFEPTVDNDHFYYRTVSPDRTTARLMAADKLTGESRLLYAGEIEDVIWLSPDARYTALVIDSDNHIDNLPGQSGDMYFSAGDELWLIDLVENRILLKTPAYECVSLDPRWCPLVKPLTDELVALQTMVAYPMSDQFSVFSLSQATMTASDIDGWLGQMLVGGWAFLIGDLQDFNGSYNEMDIYNVTTLQRVDLVTVTEDDYWLIWATHISGDRFDITIGYDAAWRGGENPLYDRITYRVRVNAPGLE